MIAIRKLQYDPARYFYPMPDLEHLHTVLTMSTTNALMMMNPSLAAVAGATPGVMQGEAGAPRDDYRTRGKFVHLVQSNLAESAGGARTLLEVCICSYDVRILGNSADTRHLHSHELPSNLLLQVLRSRRRRPPSRRTPRRRG